MERRSVATVPLRMFRSKNAMLVPTTLKGS
jgi:hypothetical protein